MISETVTHMEYGGSAEDPDRTVHAHPTISESIKEAGLAVSKTAIHPLYNVIVAGTAIALPRNRLSATYSAG
ncbi:MAG: hypothetical protein ACJ07L_08630 [Opitutales bacterium]